MKVHNSKALMRSGSALALCFVIAVPADAQEASQPAENEEQAGEIIVTAQKRTERLIDVPVAVTAVTGEALASQHIEDSTGLVRAIPSLTYQQGGAPNNSSFRIRGIGTALFGQGVEPAVSVVVDGVVAARAGQGFTDLADLERIEVLRGPQGTLFGKNATAGVINVVTQAPSDVFGGKVEATLAEGNEYRVKGTVTGPIAEGLDARVTGFYNHVGGILHNVVNGSDQYGSEGWGVRGKLRYDNGNGFDATLILDHSQNDSSCCSLAYIRSESPVVAALLDGRVPVGPGNHTTANDDNGGDLSFVKTRNHTVALEANVDLGAATITSITAWQYYREANGFEVDSLPTLPVPWVGSPNAFASWNDQFGLQRQNAFSQELRIASNGNRDFTYVGGVYAAHLDLYRYLDRTAFRCSAGTAIGDPCTGTTRRLSNGFDADFRSDNISAFGQIDWRVGGGLHLIGGARVQYEKQKVDGRVFGPLNVGDLAIGPGANQGIALRDGTGFSGRAGIRYEFNRNFQTYFTYSRGYKAFALDLGATTNFANNPGLNPEFVNAYELGLKFRTPDGAFSLNGALFRSEFTDQQVQSAIQLPGANLFQVVQINAGKTISQGLELESTIRPTDHFSLNASFTYLDASIDVIGQQCPVQINNCGPGGSSFFDVVDGRPPVAPEFRVSISPRLEGDIGNLQAFVQANMNFQSRQLFSLNQDPLTVQDAYALVDLTAGISDIDNKYRLSVFVRNLLNTNYYTNVTHAPVFGGAAAPYELTATYAKDAERYFGATIGVSF